MRWRYAGEAAAEIKAADPGSAVTERMIRNLIKEVSFRQSRRELAPAKWLTLICFCNIWRIPNTTSRGSRQVVFGLSMGTRTSEVGYAWPKPM